MKTALNVFHIFDHLDAARASEFPGDDGVNGVFPRDGSGVSACDRRRIVFSGALLFPRLPGRTCLRAGGAVDDGAGHYGAVAHDVDGQAFERRARGMGQGGDARRRAVVLLPRQLRRGSARSFQKA